mgnify:CR=1 FL=1
MKKRILTFLLFFAAFLIASSLIVLAVDEVYSYGTSYNVANGLLPYRDFNIIIGPIYCILFSPLIKLFGNYFILFKLEHCIFYALIFVLIYEKLGLKSIFLFFIFCARDPLFGYNSFVLLLFLIVLLLQDSKLKSKNIYIGIMIGLIIMSKQNIGFCLLIIYLFINRHNIKECFSIFISIVPVILYLILTSTLKEYINFCYLGVVSFFDNFYINYSAIVGYLIFFVPFIYMIITRKKKDPEILYIIAFQSIIVPIFDSSHIFAGLIPIAFYILLKNDNYVIDYYIKTFTTVFFLSFLITSVKDSQMITEDNYLKYQRVNKYVPNYLEEYSKYIDKYDDYRVFLFMENSYLIKLYRNETLDFYDMIDKGNVGKDETYYVKKMQEECKDKKCMFILDSCFYKKIYYQGLEVFKDGVEENNQFLEILPSGDRVYINKK